MTSAKQVILCIALLAAPFEGRATEVIYDFESFADRYLSCLTEQALRNGQDPEADAMHKAVQHCKPLKDFIILGYPLKGIGLEDGTYRYRLTEDESRRQIDHPLSVVARLEHLAQMRLAYCRQAECPS